ncbi:unnamed protein product [Owenia fusiformis]|uniref:Uncharacterized protein n=1 Tax=Owenia fusiformis TaxID=6347 RepID=A0A8J1XYS0_OWEFU|nr:unnamed protein product [Owenia fusiformis]
MNVMRKLIGQGHRPGADLNQGSPDNSLGLMHLRKLFAEFWNPKSGGVGGSQADKEDKLYNMLPLFCRVFGAAPSSDLTEKFSDVLQFCGHVSKLMVNEIRRRASNQSTDAASYSIVKFLEIESTEESSNGWMLLSTLNLLSTGAPSLIDCMTAASLPSTLVKCLYLFFDLPDVENIDQVDPVSDFTRHERRVLLQKVFVQLLVRLCSHVSPAEELARKDDLTLLFSAITSWCPAHNVPWRKSSSEVLMTLSRHGLTPNVVQYIHNKGCVALCIDNMQRVQELSPLELVEMFVTVFCFLKDSSEVSQILVDDFRSCQGYIYLSDFLLRMENDLSEEAKQALRNLVLLVGSLTTCGFIEIKPSSASTGSLFQMPGFSLPTPAGKGVSVRNLQAFQVLQTVFLKSNTSHLCSIILDVISSIYHQDNANYFILESQCTIAQISERIHNKPPDIQGKFFEIVEFIVFNLNFVPCKEFISLSLLLKTHNSLTCSILCMKCLLKILRFHVIYKDVYREVGLLEVMVTCLNRYASLLKDPDSDEGAKLSQIPESEQELGSLTMEALSILLNSNNANAIVFRECGGARCVHNMVPYIVCRHQVLNIVQQLILATGGDDDMGTLLGLMHTAPSLALQLKTHILKSLLNVLRESHRSRTVFRKVGGFVYVMSVLVSMEGCLANPPRSPWEKAESSELIALLKAVFRTLTVAMRYEPANAKFFRTDVRYASLTEAVRLLGCFSSEVDIQPTTSTLKTSEDHPFDEFFCNLKPHRLKEEVPKTLIHACMMVRYLYDMALDAFDKSYPVTTNDSPSTVKRALSSDLDKLTGQNSPMIKRASTGSIFMTLTQGSSEPIIVHAGAVVSMLHLLPAISCEENPQLELDLQYQVSEIMKSLVRCDRNQQVMCEAGLSHEILSHCNIALADESHILHPQLQYIFERLASQSLTPKDLRDFMRLGAPLNSNATDDNFTEAEQNNDQTTDNSNNQVKVYGGPVPLTRVKCLVSMTTPRDIRLHGASITPSFVEFDMSAEGFGCLYLPSIAPQGPPAPSVVGVAVVTGGDTTVIGGVGTGERLFPPQSGLTFSSWICIDKFCTGSEGHPVRLLTLVRNIQGREDNLICLSVMLAHRDRAMLVSTQEVHMPIQGGADFEAEPILNESMVRFWCPELTQEGQWHHVCLVFHKAGIMKNSSVSLMVDGALVSTQKLHYISASLGGGGTASPQAVTSVFAYIGTPPQLRKPSKVVWRQGPCHLLEDVMTPSMVETVYKLGPNYVGSFQAPALGKEVTGALVSEEKVIFGFYAHAMSQMTIAKIRKIYNKFDSKSIAKQLVMSTHENATPIRILHNSAGHLSGPARSLGAIIMGYLGVRTFCPKPVARNLLNIGGTSALLGLIAMATDVEGLYAAVKSLVCVVRSNKAAIREMDRMKGYQVLGMLLKKKRHLLNSHILHLTFSLIGTVDSGRESTVIPNKHAFEDLLCDLEIWREAPGDLQRSLYEHFFELLTESSELSSNLLLMNEVGLVSKLLHVFKDNNLSLASQQTIASVLTVLLRGAKQTEGLLRFGQFMTYTLPTMSVSEQNANVTPHDGLEHVTENTGLVSAYNIRIRNLMLEIVIKLLINQNGTLNLQFADDLQRVLGFDWLLLFLQGHLHRSTVVLSMRLLVTMLSHSTSLQRFREGTHGGGWLNDTEAVLKSSYGIVVGFNMSSSNNKSQQNHEINQDTSHIPGFTSLQWLLPKHSDIHELYFLLMALLLGQPVKRLPECEQFDLDSVWTFIFGVPASQSGAKKANNRAELCPEAAFVILSMIRYMLNQPESLEGEGTWLHEYPITLMQFLLFLYHNQADFIPLCMSEEFLCGLVATLFPYRLSSVSSSEVSSPVDEFKPYPGSEDMVLIESSPQSTVNTETKLTSHPAKKFVLDFMRMIVVDSLSLPSSSKTIPVIDNLLDASPEHSTPGQQRELQTEVLKGLMDHLLAADALLGEQAALPIAIGGSYGNMASNVFYFASRVVDKLWQGSYVRDSKEVFEFISNLIAQAKRKASGLSLDPIYKSLNRCLLYRLSRPLYAVSSQMTILDSLHKITCNRTLVFGPGNYDQEFLGCLSYLLLTLTEDVNGSANGEKIDEQTNTKWHIMPDDPQNNTDLLNRSSDKLGQEGLQLVANAAKRVWEELYVCKKPTLEEIFKVTLNPSLADPTAKVTTPELHNVRPMISEGASRMWLAYVDWERTKSVTEAQKLQNQLQSKLAKMSSGVLRLAGKKTKRETPYKNCITTPAEMNMWTWTHVAIVRDLVELHYKQYLQAQSHMQKILYEEWHQTETALLRERGLWGPSTGSSLEKWMLDMTEGPCRMLKKMMRNDFFYIHYPYYPEGMENVSRKYKMAVSYDSEKYYKRFQSKSLIGEDIGPQAITKQPQLMQEESVEKEEELSLTTSNLLKRQGTAASTDAADDDNDVTDISTEPNISEGPNPDNQTVLRLLEEDEKITHMFRCARIQGLDTSEGLLLFGREHFYVLDGYTLLKTKEITDIDNIPADKHEPIIPKTTMCVTTTMKRMCSKFTYEDIKEIHKRRYLLQPIALEVFSSDGRNFLLAFPRKLRNKIYAKFMAVATSITDNAQQSVSGQKQNAKVEPGTGLISSLMGEKSVTQRWERGEISNFQYIMALNTLAGRSYNDLMQYPVFPWIVADYDSQDLDLSDPATFRDLSKPMGVQTEKRLGQFQKRYRDWDDPAGETPPYHYGTHYSSAMIVASYLVRMEPFTQHFLRLQGGHFDLADRMFHSVREGWLSASKHNMADVKELIPEFFYLPEFLRNANKFDLGSKQSGVVLDNVILPTWAKGDAREFIRAHREALECDYVSAHLHEWIDLIFGAKQQGPAAYEAMNVFHHLFYEGNVDIYSIDDPLKKNATIGFINNFGQIPKQLFKKPHPQKKLNIRLLEPVSMPNVVNTSADKLFFHNLDILKPAMQPVKELKGAVGQIWHNDRNVLAVEQHKVLIPPSGSKFLAWGFSDLSLRIGSYDSEKASAIYENLDQGDIMCASCPNGKTIVTGGTSTDVCVWQMGTGKHKKQLQLKQALYGHTEPVTCISASQSYNIIVSGSRDRTCIVWDMTRLIFVRQLRGHAAPVAAVAINDLTGDIATCAGTYVHVWSINGDEIASVNAATGTNQQILCVAFSQMMEWDVRNVVMTGGSDGVVRMWSIEFVQVPDETKTKKKDAMDGKDSDKAAVIERLAQFKSPGPIRQYSETQDGESVLSETNTEDTVRVRDPLVASRLHALNSSSMQTMGDVMSLDDETSRLSDTGIESGMDALTELETYMTKTTSQSALKELEVKVENGDDPEGPKSPSSDFVILSDSEVKNIPKSVDDVIQKYSPKRRQDTLREGFKWQRQLVFRSKLTMHTAFERKDNREPAAVTAIASSKDHKCVYVGDVKGRVFSWSVSDQPGRTMADHWVKDEGGDSCLACSVKFSFSERRHHCRNCGQLFCSKCSKFESEIHRLKIMKPVRVCQACFNIVNKDQDSGAKPVYL